MEAYRSEVRVLMVNVSLAGDPSGTGHTLRNLFEGMPQSRLMQLSLQFRPPEVRTIVANTVFIDEQCVPTYTRARKAVGWLRALTPRGSVRRTNVQPANSITQTSRLGRARSTLSGLLDMSRCMLTVEIMEEIERFAPTVIYTAGSSIRVHTVVNHLAETLGIPVVLHLMDDWPETVYRSTWLSRLPRAALSRALARTNELSYINFAISAPLCEKYMRVFGKEYLPLMNPAVHFVNSIELHNRPVAKFVYAGSIGLGRDESLLQVARAIADINQMEERVEFTLYIPDTQNSELLRSKFGKFGAVVCGYLPIDELRERFADADVLVYAESFSLMYREFTHLSLSTKVPEYMAAGKPILALLPSDLYGSDYINERQCGIVVNDPAELRPAVQRLAHDAELRLRLARAGLRAAQDEHASSVVRARLEQTLTNVSRLAQAQPHGSLR